jgi:hypothetical protein
MGWTGGILYVVCISKTSAHFSALQANGMKMMSVRQQEKGKAVRSQYKDNFTCVQTSYMFRLCIAIIRLNKNTVNKKNYNTKE